MDDNIYAPLSGVEHSGEGINGCHPRNAKALLTNWLLLYAKSVKCKTNVSWYEMRYILGADVGHRNVRAVIDRHNVKLGGFRSQLEASKVSSHPERVVIQRNSLSVDDNIYIYIYAHTCMHIHTCMNTHTHTHAHANKHMHERVHKHTHTHTHIYIYRERKR